MEMINLWNISTTVRGIICTERKQSVSGRDQFVEGINMGTVIV